MIKIVDSASAIFNEFPRHLSQTLNDLINRLTWKKLSNVKNTE